MKKPRVSIVLPVFNDSKRLEKCLSSIQSQRFPLDEVEIIVVDNGSAENLREITDRFPHVKLLQEKKAGSYSARNKGIKEAAGKIIAFTDADCLPDKDWLEKGVLAISKMESPCLVAGKVQIFFEDKSRPPNWFEYYEYAMALRQEKNIRHKFFGATANLFTTRRTLELIGLFDETLLSGGDFDWGRRLHKAGGAQLYCGEALVFHPARSNRANLVKKMRRMAGGRHQISQGINQSGIKSDRDDKSYRAPRWWTTIGQIYKDPVVGGIRSTSKVLLVALFVLMVINTERIRLTLGGKPIRG